MLTIHPRFCRIISGTTIRARTNPAFRLSCIIWSKTRGSTSHRFVPPAYPPTVFTRMSTRPYFATVPAMNFSTAGASVTSTAAPSGGFAPIRSAEDTTAANSSARLYVTITLAPASSKAMVTSRPRPPLPPEIKTILSWKFICSSERGLFLAIRTKRPASEEAGYNIYRKGLFRGRVIPAARKGRVILVFHFHTNLPVAAVSRLIERKIADGVLAAQFFGDLIEGLLKIFLVAHDNHAPAGFVGQFLGNSLIASVGGNQQNVDDRIVSLSRLDGVLQLQLASRILGIGQNDHGFPAGFIGELVVRREVDGVVEIGAAIVAARRDGSLPDTTRRRISLCAINGAVESRVVVREISEKIHVQVESHNHGEIALAHHAPQESRSHFFFDPQHEFFAAAGVNQQPESDWKVGLRGEVGNFLGLAILKDLKVIHL